ncbi:MAG: molybdopterin-binding protein [Syntrophobacteraceae bacterium]
MEAEILTIGNEILSGHIVNSNAAWIGRQLNAAGIAVGQMTSVADTKERIAAALERALDGADFVVITGGLGPTRDDVTKKALCEFFHTDLVFSEEVFGDVKRYISSRQIPENDLHRTQAMVPRDCIILRNSRGTAPGMWFKKDGKIIVSLPGVPSEMKAMMQGEVLPKIRSTLTPGTILYKSVLVHGISESNLALKLARWERDLPSCFELASLPHGGYLHLRLGASGRDECKLDQSTGAEMDKLRNIIGEYIHDFSDRSPEQVLGDLLREKNLNIAIIECGTDGALAGRLTSIPTNLQSIAGAATALTGQAVAAISGIEPALIGDGGPTSREAAESMAARFRERLGSTLAVATSSVSAEAEERSSESRSLWMAIASAEGVKSEKVAATAYHVDKMLFMLLEYLRGTELNP